MSGIEAAGIALAVLPLLVSAVQNYDKCLEPFRRYRDFPNEAQRFLKLLKIQRTIFRNHSAILLGNFIDQDAALTLLHSPCEQTSQNIKLEKELHQLLSDSKEACVDIIELIIGQLTATERECRDVVTAMESENQPSKFSGAVLSWRRRTRTRLRFSFSKSRLKEHLVSLQTLNANFKTLAFQSLKLGEQLYSHDEDTSKTALQEIAKFEAIRKVSRQVHEALRKACNTYAEHSAHAGAEVEYCLPKNSLQPQVKFRMVLETSDRRNDYISFIVDTTLEDVESSIRSGSTSDLNNPEGSLNDYLANSRTRGFESATLALRPPISITAPSVNLSHQGDDFCEHLRQCRSFIVGPQCHAGTLKTATGYKTSVFLLATDSTSRDQHAISLGQLLSTLSDSRKSFTFPLHQRLGLAKVLATAVLQYHATPWLQLSWQSNDVVFFTRGENPLQRESHNFEIPHFHTIINSGDQTLAPGQQAVVKSAAEARNSLLYSLGIVLFEIGCWTAADRCSDLTQARQLLNSGRCSGRFEMGPRYDEIVEKLIECDFGCGADLNKATLQTAVYRDVICPLEKLESDFRALQVGS